MPSAPSGGSETPVRFPNRIARAREIMRLKVTDLARIVGVSRSHLSKVEAGEQIPNAVILHDIAQALEVPLLELFDEAWSSDRQRTIGAQKAFVEDR